MVKAKDPYKHCKSPKPNSKLRVKCTQSGKGKKHDPYEHWFMKLIRWSK